MTLFKLPVMSGSILGLCADHLVGPGPTGSVRDGLPLMLCVSTWKGPLLGYSHNFCITFTPAHLVGRTNYKSKVI